jgi:hypothetical protein
MNESKDSRSWSYGTPSRFLMNALSSLCSSTVVLSFLLVEIHGSASVVFPGTRGQPLKLSLLLTEFDQRQPYVPPLLLRWARSQVALAHL